MSTGIAKAPPAGSSALISRLNASVWAAANARSCCWTNCITSFVLRLKNGTADPSTSLRSGSSSCSIVTGGRCLTSLALKILYSTVACRRMSATTAVSVSLREFIRSDVELMMPCSASLILRSLASSSRRRWLSRSHAERALSQTPVPHEISAPKFSMLTPKNSFESCARSVRHSTLSNCASCKVTNLSIATGTSASTNASTGPARSVSVNSSGVLSSGRSPPESSQADPPPPQTPSARSMLSRMTLPVVVANEAVSVTSRCSSTKLLFR